MNLSEIIAKKTAEIEAVIRPWEYRSTKEISEMGFNTTVVILNDGLSDIAKDPTFGKRLADAINGVGDKPIYIPGLTMSPVAVVVESHHADYTTLVAIGGNCASVLYSRGYSIHHTKEAKWDILEEALDHLTRPDSQ